ncbi:MAG: RluA family pseudouridine synthase [Muribaculaceae bacterium]|nr:RluA family pseudouridine synthase [Muribaculaceae bacterium]
MANRRHDHRVPRNDDKAVTREVKQPCKLLDFVMQTLDGISRNKAKSILAHGGVSVDGQVQSHVDYPLVEGCVVQIRRHARPSSARSPYYRIVYEDRWVVVVDKQQGVLSMPVGAGSLNMKSLLDRHFAETHQRCTAHVVHRLDCRTSGLMVYAKSVDVQQQMTADWHSTIIDRRYVAVVEGVMEEPAGKVESWLHDTDRMIVVSSPVDDGGKWAATEWEVVEQAPARTLLFLHLLTGRKNQIRVHMADLGHPVVGDGKYGHQDDPGSRMCLHAFRLAFNHPVTGEPLYFETPIPRYFGNALHHAP